MDPFGGEIRDGAVWGRGSVDMKGGLTSQLACAKAPRRHARPAQRIAGAALRRRRGVRRAGDAVADRARVRRRLGDHHRADGARDRDRRARHGLVSDPYHRPLDARRGAAGRGSIRSRRSRRCSPRCGATTTSCAVAAIPLLGHPICTVTMISGGAEHNAVPDSCELTIDRRLIPGEIPRLGRGGAAHAGCRADRSTPRPDGRSAHDPPPVRAGRGARPERVHRRRQVAPCTRSPALARPDRGTPYGSDVRNLVNDAGMEAITFGAGDVSMCHCPDERQSLEELRQATLVMARVATESARRRRMSTRIGVDVGGTFTDLIAYDPASRQRSSRPSGRRPSMPPRRP